MALGAASMAVLVGAGTYLGVGLLMARPWQLTRALVCGVLVAALHLLLLGLGWVIEGSLLAYAAMIVSSACIAAAMLQGDFSKRGGG
jgi:hypothetical protein